MLNFRQVEAFRQTVLAGSVSSAARIINTSQPNVSRLLRELERAVGFRLFDRKRRGVSPTPEASRLHEHIERAFVGLAEIERAAAEIREGAQGHIAIATVPACAFELVPSSIIDLSRRRDGLTIDVQVWTTTQIVESVRAGRIDVGIVSPLEDRSEAYAFAKRRLEYVAIMRKDHPLARKTAALRVEDLEPHELVIPDPQYLAARCSDQRLAEYLRASARLTSYVSYAAATMVMNGLGAALVDPLTARFFSRHANLVVRPLESAPRYDLSILRAPSRRHVGPVAQLATILLSKLDDLAAPASMPGKKKK